MLAYTTKHNKKLCRVVDLETKLELNSFEVENETHHFFESDGYLYYFDSPNPRQIRTGAVVSINYSSSQWYACN